MHMLSVTTAQCGNRLLRRLDEKPQIGVHGQKVKAHRTVLGHHLRLDRDAADRLVQRTAALRGTF